MPPFAPKASKGTVQFISAPIRKKTVLKHGYAKTLAAQPIGSGAEIVGVEADLTRGLHSFSIVGLADKAVAEAPT